MHHYFPTSVWKKRKPPLKKWNKNSHTLSESQPAQVDISCIWKVFVGSRESILQIIMHRWGVSEERAQTKWSLCPKCLPVLPPWVSERGKYIKSWCDRSKFIHLLIRDHHTIRVLVIIALVATTASWCGIVRFQGRPATPTPDHLPLAVFLQ